ncbi:MAG: hypothetical protein J7621_19485 [Niastella sp.]|nr:hypothetical protein [Niastella sp.]
MGNIFVPLQLTHNASGIYLHPLRGADEMLVEDVSTRTALLLLENIVHRVNPEVATGTFKVADIVTADRDRIFAALYLSMYGNTIQSTLTCRHCGSPFDLDFSLSSLLDHYQLSAAGSSEGVYEIDQDGRFRLPTGADELLLTEFSETTAEDFLLSRCLIKGDITKIGGLVQEKMAEIAPVLNLAMQAHCPECGTNQEVHFDIQTFFLTRLKQEYPQLIREVHRIAGKYHWSADTILNLPRHLRKQYVVLIESEL